MGAAQTKNSSEIIASISNFVDNSTTVNSNAVNDVRNRVELNECKLKAGEVNIETISKSVQKNNQIVNAKQDANLNNNIQQKMLQESLSKVGSLGLGFANASNSTTVIANASNEIINAMNVSSNQYSTVHNSFNCNNSTILAKNINIAYESYGSFLSEQTLKNDQVAAITNEISQSVDQKATAEVEGISGMIILLLIVLAVLVYVAMKPLSSGGGKIIVGVLMCFLITIVLIGMYIRGTPPFFADLDECIHNSSLGTGGSNCTDYSQRKIKLSSAPIKYLYGITPFDRSQPGANLVQMSIAAKSGQVSSSGVNGGYRGDTWSNLETALANYTQYAQNLNIPMIPNPLVIPQKTADNVTNYYLIPGEYGGNSTETKNNGLCTPGTIQVGIDSSEKKLSSCPRIAAPEAFRTTTNFGTGKDIVANLNNADWQDYINMTGRFPQSSNFQGDDEALARALFARFVLCDIIGNIDLHYYISENEYIRFLDNNNNKVIKLARNAITENPQDVYMYHPYILPGSHSDGIISSGYIDGYVGYVDNTNYRYQVFMRNIGVYICIGIIVFILLLMFYLWKTNKKEKGEGKEGEGGEERKTGTATGAPQGTPQGGEGRTVTTTASATGTMAAPDPATAAATGTGTTAAPSPDPAAAAATPTGQQ